MLNHLQKRQFHCNYMGIYLEILVRIEVSYQVVSNVASDWPVAIFKKKLSINMGFNVNHKSPQNKLISDHDIKPYACIECILGHNEKWPGILFWCYVNDIGIWAWISNNIQVNNDMWTKTCPNFNGGLLKRHWSNKASMRNFILYKTMDAILYPCHNSIQFLLIKSMSNADSKMHWCI